MTTTATSPAPAMAIGSGFGTVSMPVGLAARVRVELGITMLSGPVLADSLGARWVFLTECPTEVRPVVMADLSALGVHLVRNRGPLVIAAEATVRGGRTWHWIEPPVTARALPPAHAVIAITRRVAAGFHRTA